MIVRLTLFISLVICQLQALAQQQAKGVVVDAETRDALPFATIKYGNPVQGLVTDINGRFSFQTGASQIQVSYIGYDAQTVSVNANDTIFLEPSRNSIDEVVIKPPYEKIRGIVNRAIKNKPTHNPDKYDWYSCNIYYKMKADLNPTEKYLKKDTGKNTYREFAEKSHVFFSETYNKRVYKSPQQLQEIVYASRFSGFKKTYFTNLVTGWIPFHVYEEEVKLIGNNYLHPVAKGWQSRYEFDLIDELYQDGDTTFILKYRPKRGAAFNSLTGMVYINSNGYAISHITAIADDTLVGRRVEMEQIYSLVNGKWFPRELNYEFMFKKYPDPQMGATLVGHSIIDSVSFIEDKGFKFDKARPVLLTDSVDNHSAAQWDQLRPQAISEKEAQTYTLIDSLSDKSGINKMMDGMGSLRMGRVPIGVLDLDVKKIFSFNTYEKIRLGLGLYTNDKVSKYFSVGGWFGYGFGDKVWKYGASARVFPGADKNNWLELAYEKNYRNSGSYNIHRDIDRVAFRNLLLQRVDLIDDYKLSYHDRFGYWETDLYARYQELRPQYAYTFDAYGSANPYIINEVGVGLRYAFAEKRTPLFGFYIPVSTKYPIVYLSLSGGQVSRNTYQATYGRLTAAIAYNVHINRWGKDNFLLTGGMIQAQDTSPLPKQLLLAANGFRLGGKSQLYQWGGFITMLPYQYFNDKFVSLFYKHDFDKCFYQHPYSKPFLSIAHNIMWGELSNRNKLANVDINGSGIYQESGLILNHLARFDYLHVGYIGVDFGYFYNWTNAPVDLKKYGRVAIGISFSF